MSMFVYPATIAVDTAGFYLVTFSDVPEAGTDAESRCERETAYPTALPLVPPDPMPLTHRSPREIATSPPFCPHSGLTPGGGSVWATCTVTRANKP